MKQNIRDEKLQSLKTLLRSMQSVLIAYSGGVDSTFLLKIAHEVLGENVLAVTELSPVYPSEETELAEKLAREMGVKHQFLKTQELSNPNFLNNPKERCYWCKKDLFGDLIKIAKQHTIDSVLDGANYDDIGDWRPGMKAGAELGVHSPLKEVQLTKDDIRYFSKELGLPTWNKPSFACLASRFPYGTKITKEKLETIDQAERFLRGLGFIQIRVRHHETIARIEVLAEDILRISADPVRQQIVSYFRQLGYAYIALDLEGYRMGSMNEVLQDQPA